MDEDTFLLRHITNHNYNQSDNQRWLRGGENETGKRRTFESLEKLERAFRDLLKGIVWHPTDNAVTRYVKITKTGKDRINAKIYTPEHVYSISATTGGYLGCIASTRKATAGENWTRGNDLPDGPFNKRTWERIKNSIIGYELEPLSTETLAKLERQGIDTGDEKAKELAKFREVQNIDGEEQKSEEVTE